MSIAIDGGTPRQRRQLAQVLRRLGPTAIERVRLEPHLPSLEDTPFPTRAAATRGWAFELIAPETPSTRTAWEASLAAIALRGHLRDDGDPSEEIVWLQLASGPSVTLQWVDSAAARLSPSTMRTLSAKVGAAAATSGAQLERVELLHPRAHALAAHLFVAEPHSFLRQRFNGFLADIEPCVVGCASQTYIEVRDGHDEPALVIARAAYGTERLRRDLACCDPLTHPGGLNRPPAKRCPVFD